MKLILQFSKLFLELAQPARIKSIAPLSQSNLPDRYLGYPMRKFIHLIGQTVQPVPYHGTALIHQVKALTGEETIGDITVR
jgi:hypothetical protein